MAILPAHFVTTLPPGHKLLIHNNLLVVLKVVAKKWWLTPTTRELAVFGFPQRLPVHTIHPPIRSVGLHFDRNTLSAHLTRDGLVSAFTALQSHKRPRNGQKMAVVFIPLFSGCVLAVYKWSSMWGCGRFVTCRVCQYFDGSLSRESVGKPPLKTHPGFPCRGGKFGIALLKQYMTDTVKF